MNARHLLALLPLSSTLIVACTAPLPLPTNISQALHPVDQERSPQAMIWGRGPHAEFLEASMPEPSIAEDPGVQALKDQSKRDFLGVSWGVGPSITFDTGSHDRVSDASLDPNGVVRVDDVDNNLVRITLETHYFFEPTGAFPVGGVKAEKWGWGPFVAIQPSDTEIIDALGFGLMLGFRYTEQSPASFNIGLGWMIDPNSKVLGDGINENQPLPTGETSIRFQERSQSGILLMFSFSF